MKYIVGRRNLACTIFVPFDCNNNCPFCTSKKMYKNIKLNPDEIINKILKINENPDIVEFVLTGGEPFANIDETKKIVSAMKKRCFINTTLPMTDNIEDIIDFINTENKIQGINISRHVGFNFKGVADVNIIDKIKKPIRINTVINKNFSFDEFKKFVEKWGNENRMINLRADYTKLDTTSLKSRDEIETLLSEEYLYNGSGGCLVCHSTAFETDNCVISYHRGLMFSSVKMKDKIYINDVIITPDGNIYKDWDFVNDDDFNKWALKIPDIKETYISVIVDWDGNKDFKQYFYSNMNNDSVSLTSIKDKAKKITLNSEIDEITRILKKQLKNHLVEINIF